MRHYWKDTHLVVSDLLALSIAGSKKQLKGFVKSQERLKSNYSNPNIVNNIRSFKKPQNYANNYMET